MKKKEEIYEEINRMEGIEELYKEIEQIERKRIKIKNQFEKEIEELSVEDKRTKREDIKNRIIKEYKELGEDIKRVETKLAKMNVYGGMYGYM